MEKREKAPQKLSTTRALALYKQMDLGKNAYNLMAQASNEHGAKIFPNYRELSKEKQLTWIKMRCVNRQWNMIREVKIEYFLAGAAKANDVQIHLICTLTAFFSRSKNQSLEPICFDEIEGANEQTAFQENRTKQSKEKK